jgi:hypothetical protein
MTTNIRTIIGEVGQWAEQQPWHPDRHAPDYGCIEELGEAMHCILKNIQQIRGFENEEYFKEKVADAFGDFMVYLSHWCFLTNSYYSLRSKISPELDPPLRPVIAQLLLALTQMFTYTEPMLEHQAVACTIACRAAVSLQEMAAYCGLDLLEDCLIPTWDKVKKRNWKKDQMHGGENA